MSDRDKTEMRGEPKSIYFEPEVLAELDKKAGQLERSRSWFVNRALKQLFGIVDEDMLDS